MQTKMDCIHCYVNQVSKISESLNLPDCNSQQLMNKVLAYLSKLDYSRTNPEIMGDVLTLIKNETMTSDPYKELKSSFNQALLKVYEEMKAILYTHGDRLIDYIKLAIYGNIIDYGIFQHVENGNWLETVENQLESFTFQIDDSDLLISNFEIAEKLLYIGDNCGELVFDKLFIEKLKNVYPKMEIIYCVRGEAVLNDNTYEDALEVGMDKLVTVIDDGASYPGFVYSEISEQTKLIFDQADIIIAKGQGNFESLEALGERKVFFLFMAKCEMLSRELKVPMNSKMCKQAD